MRLRVLAPVVFVFANAVAFSLLKPGVPDLWAARARASAASHGVGLTYWFSWFGGTTPGNYSVLTPTLSAAFGTELVAAFAAVATSVVVASLVGGTRRPDAAAWVAALSTVLNLWCGRVPFLVGTAFGVGALLCVKRRQTFPAAALAVLSVLASPVAGAFVGLGLSGLVLSRRRGEYRAAALITVACAGAALGCVALAFGAPGPEPFPLYLLGEIVLVLGLMLLSAPPEHLRLTLTVSALAALLLFGIPNGLGANFARLALFGLPAAAVALSARGSRALAALTLPALVLGALSSVSAVVSATSPASSAAYYSPLANELDSLRTLVNHRLELVNNSHAAYAALLDHAVLARGWETQQDLALNGPLDSIALDARDYRAWLDDNAVGFIAVGGPDTTGPEARVITSARPGYLHEVWSSAHWRLYAVRRPTPIVAAPAALEASTQAQMTVQVPCVCRTTVRIRWSPYLAVAPQLAPGTPDAVEDTYRPGLGHDGSGWTTLTTDHAGVYVLDGSL